MIAYVTGTSTREVDDLVRALGCESGVSKSTVSRICQDIDREIAPVRQRPLGHTTFPNVFLDATYVKGSAPGLVDIYRGRCPRGGCQSWEEGSRLFTTVEF